MPIDRSKPLPIHKFPSLIDEVDRLKELAKKEASTTYKQAGDEFGYECAVLNATPKLLDALDFQPGDASALEEIADILEEAGFVAKAAYVRRYRDMANRMEANR
jgi:hypothetical protein